jgi:hypothetical protein
VVEVDLEEPDADPELVPHPPAPMDATQDIQMVTAIRTIILMIFASIYSTP